MEETDKEMIRKRIQKILSPKVFYTFMILCLALLGYLTYLQWTIGNDPVRVAESLGYVCYLPSFPML